MRQLLSVFVLLADRLLAVDRRFEDIAQVLLVGFPGFAERVLLLDAPSPAFVHDSVGVLLRKGDLISVRLRDP